MDIRDSSLCKERCYWRARRIIDSKIYLEELLALVVLTLCNVNTCPGQF